MLEPNISKPISLYFIETHGESYHSTRVCFPLRPLILVIYLQLGAHYLQPIAELAAEFIPDADDADSVEPDTAFFFALVQGLNDCVQKLEARVRVGS